MRSLRILTLVVAMAGTLGAFALAIRSKSTIPLARSLLPCRFPIYWLSMHKVLIPANMEDLIGKSGNGISTIGCLRPGCGNKVDIQHEKKHALICNDLKCSTYISCISPKFLDLNTFASEYYNEINKFNILGGRKNKDVKEDLLSKRDDLKAQILHAYKKTLADNYVQRKKRAREIREDITLLATAYKEPHMEPELQQHGDQHVELIDQTKRLRSNTS